MKTFTDIIAEAKSAETAEIERKINNLRHKLSNLRRQGKDTSQVEADIESLKQQLAQSRANDASGGTPSSSSTPSTPQKDYSKDPDYKEGYDAAMEAIKEAKNNGNDMSGGSGDSDSGLEGIPMDPSNQNQQGQGGSGSKSGNQQGQSRGSGSQGEVSPEDCIDPTGAADDMPETAGGVMSKADGDKIAEAEGYKKEGGSDESLAKDWQDAANKAASKMAGKGPGYDAFRAKILDLYKSKKDWKKELRKIVGRCISEEDKRRGYTSNNILVSQDRIALTDKQKFDNLDYMLICLDTSGSFMGDQDYLNQSLTEVVHVAYAKKPIKIYIVQWDTRITDIKEYTEPSQLLRDVKSGKFQMKGGGGTDPKCIWDLLRTDKRFRRIRPELTMIYTDGYLDPQKRDSRRMQHLIWVVMDNPGFTVQADSFTKVLHIKLKN